MTERRDLIASLLGVDPALIAFGLDEGGLDVGTANAFIENAVGTRSFAYAVVPSVLINGKDFVVPLAVEAHEEDATRGFIGSLSRAALLVNEAGGIEAEAVGSSTMVAQVQLTFVQNLDEAAQAISLEEKAVLAAANAAVSSLVARGGGARSVVCRPLGEGMLAVHVHVDCGDAMGANLVNTIAEAVAPRLAEIARGQVGIRILTNLCDDRRVKASCVLDSSAISLTATRLKQIETLGLYDASFAAAHNKAVMDAVDGVVIATGNDWRAVEAGVHAFAARDGTYRAVASWTTDDRSASSPSSSPLVHGSLDIPLALGTVGGTLRTHRAAQLSLRLLGVERAGELATVAAALGLLSSLVFVSSTA